MAVKTEIYQSGPYKGDGVCTQFRVDFPFLEVSHLLVMLMDYDQSKQLELGVDYTVGNINASAGDVYLNQPLKPGQSLIIKRNVPFTQLADYVQGDAFPVESHEMALDKLTMISQQIKEGVDRAIKTSETEKGFEILPWAQREGKLLGFDSHNGMSHAITIANGLTLKSNFIQVLPQIGLLVDKTGLSVLYGDGLGVYDKAIVIKLGKGVCFDEQARIQIQNELLELISASVGTLLDLSSLVANLAKRVAELELIGGGEVAIYIGSGLQFDGQGQLVVKPGVGIKVDATGVNIFLGDGLEVNAAGEVTVSQALKNTVERKANQSYVDEAFGKCVTNDGLGQILNEQVAVIFPNGGTPENPGEISVNNRYVVANPFPDHEVDCITKVFYDNEWGEAPFIGWRTSTEMTGLGIKTTQLGNQIIIQTGDVDTLLYTSAKQGNSFNILVPVSVASLPAKVIVTKKG